MALEINKVLPLGQKPEGELDPMGKLEEAKNNLFKNIEKLELNIKILKEKNLALENFVKNMEVKKNGHK